MVLESTMICVDDSDYMRNGDFVPTRMAAMQDAVNMVCHTKTRSNPENNVGLLTLASSEVLTTLTTDASKLMSKMLAVQPQGELKLMSGLRVASLALKHRQGKNHKMRIVVFIGSPIQEIDSTELIRLAKRLKKEKVNVDIISFGDGAQESLQQFVDTLNGREGTASHLVVVPPGPTLTDALMASPIFQEDGAPVGGGGRGFDFGVDPNDDPELALALRVSMEEQRARQEAESRNTVMDEGTEATSNEEKMLEKALAMSRPETGGAGTSGGESSGSRPMDFASMTEEQQMEYALQMSMQENIAASSPKKESNAEAVTQVIEPMDVDESSGAETSAAIADTQPIDPDFQAVIQDTQFLQAVLEGLPEGAEIKKETLDSANKLAEKEKEKEKSSPKSRTSGGSSSGTSSTASKRGSSGGAGTEKKKTPPKK
jgi:26S proteasome regulatory subunit N10